MIKPSKDLENLSSLLNSTSVFRLLTTQESVKSELERSIRKKDTYGDKCSVLEAIFTADYVSAMDRLEYAIRSELDCKDDYTRQIIEMCYDIKGDALCTRESVTRFVANAMLSLAKSVKKREEKDFSFSDQSLSDPAGKLTGQDFPDLFKFITQVGFNGISIRVKEAVSVKIRLHYDFVNTVEFFYFFHDEDELKRTNLGTIREFVKEKMAKKKEQEFTYLFCRFDKNDEPQILNDTTTLGLPEVDDNNNLKPIEYFLSPFVVSVPRVAEKYKYTVTPLDLVTVYHHQNGKSACVSTLKRFGMKTVAEEFSHMLSEVMGLNYTGSLLYYLRTTDYEFERREKVVDLADVLGSYAEDLERYEKIIVPDNVEELTSDTEIIKEVTDLDSRNTLRNTKPDLLHIKNHLIPDGYDSFLYQKSTEGLLKRNMSLIRGLLNYRLVAYRKQTGSDSVWHCLQTDTSIDSKSIKSKQFVPEDKSTSGTVTDYIYELATTTFTINKD